MGNCVQYKNEIYLLRSAVRFGHFQLFSGQFDGLNQTLLLTELQKANKIFQPNLGSGRNSKIDLDFSTADSGCELVNTELQFRQGR